MQCLFNFFSVKFLSTLSLRRATPGCHDKIPHFNISIHALLAESDKNRKALRPQKSYFYPRSPCGERLIDMSFCSVRTAFLSTLSLRRATFALQRWKRALQISIHALLAESDFRFAALEAGFTNFYPRSPCGERHETTPNRVG